MSLLIRKMGGMILLVLFCTDLQAQLQPQPRVVGGSTAATATWPSTVAFYLHIADSSRYRFCAGTLVAPNWVLTSAHCFFNSDGAQDIYPDQIEVVAGQQNLAASSAGHRLDVQNLVIHPRYRKSSLFDYDAALLELAYPLDIQPMPLLANSVEKGEVALVAGWGLSELDANGDVVDGSFANHLQEAELRITDNNTCQNTMNYPLTDNMLCAGYAPGGRDSCSGDSGGPLVVARGDSRYQVGIVSFGDGCGKQGKFGVYTRITRINDWVRSYTEIEPIEALEEAVVSDVESEFYERFSPTVTESNITARGGGGALLWLLLAGGLLRMKSRLRSSTETD